MISVFMDQGLDCTQLDLKKLRYSFSQGKWTRIYVTLDFLEAANRSLDFIRLGGYAKGTYYVDDVRLVSMIGEGFAAGLFQILLVPCRFKNAMQRLLGVGTSERPER